MNTNGFCEQCNVKGELKLCKSLYAHKCPKCGETNEKPAIDRYSDAGFRINQGVK